MIRSLVSRTIHAIIYGVPGVNSAHHQAVKKPGKSSTKIN